MVSDDPICQLEINLVVCMIVGMHVPESFACCRRLNLEDTGGIQDRLRLLQLVIGGTLLVHVES